MLDVVEDTGEYKSALIGDLKGKAVKNSSICKVAGLEDNLLGAQQLAKNEDFIILFPRPNGDVMQIGSEAFAAHFDKFDMTTGTNAKGLAGADIEASAMDVGAIKYEATITIHP